MLNNTKNGFLHICWLNDKHSMKLLLYASHVNGVFRSLSTSAPGSNLSPPPVVFAQIMRDV